MAFHVPDPAGIRDEALSALVDRFLNAQDPKVTPEELIMVMMALYMRLRTALTLGQVQNAFTIIIPRAELLLESGGAFVDSNGDHMPIVTPEKILADPELGAMVEAHARLLEGEDVIPDTIEGLEDD